MAANSTPNRRGKKSTTQRATRYTEAAGHKPNTSHTQDTLDEMADDASDYAGAAADYVSASIEEVREQAAQMTRGREGTVVMTALGIGFGIGIALGLSLVGSQRRSTSWRDRRTAEGIGRHIMERIEAMLPQNVTDCWKE